jgi:hypothetical protein
MKIKTQVGTHFYLQPIEKREFQALLITNVFFWLLGVDLNLSSLP